MKEVSFEEVEYKNYIISEYWLPHYAKYIFSHKDNPEDGAFTGNTIDECKIKIDDLID